MVSQGGSVITGLPQGEWGGDLGLRGPRGLEVAGGLVSLCQVVADFVAEEKLMQATGGDAEAIKEAIT